MQVIAYAYDADIHCPGCAAEVGMDEDGAVDREGNEVGAVFDHSEVPAEGLYCGDCHEEIVEPWDEPEDDDEDDDDEDDD